MMGKNRSWPDIVANMLWVAAKGARKTKIMYKCNLGSKQTGKYVKFCMDKGLLSLPNGDGVYEITPKGKIFLENYHKMYEALSNDNERNLGRLNPFIYRRSF